MCIRDSIYIIIGMMSLGMMFYAMFNMTALYTVVMALVFFMCIIYQPIGLYLKAAQQVKNNEAFSRPITYTFRDWDIEVRQGDSHGELPWDEITKAIVTKDMLLIYNGKASPSAWAGRFFALFRMALLLFVITIKMATIDIIILAMIGVGAVSYTHLDVYKRQHQYIIFGKAFYLHFQVGVGHGLVQ